MMSIIESALAAALIGGGVIYATVCLAAFAGLMKRVRTTYDYRPRVDIIIAARNEEENIGALLDDLTVQDYPLGKMTICVVDDCSSDKTADVVNSYSVRFDNIRLCSTENSQSPYKHKKKAVHEGILSTDGEIIMTVDADCRVKRDWISRMIQCFTPGVDLAAGEIHVEGSGVAAGLEILEFTGIQMMSAGLMNAGFPITCNGANLAYRRKAFERVGGFKGVGHVVSGDDDLLMQKIARGNRYGAVYATGSERAVSVKANATVHDFIVQRTRWASKTTSYPSKKVVFLLSLFFLFFAAILVWVIAAAAGIFDIFPLIAALCLKTVGDALLTGYGLIRRGDIRYMALFPLAEILHAPYILYVTVKGCFGTFVWQGRRTNAKA